MHTPPSRRSLRQLLSAAALLPVTACHGSLGDATDGEGSAATQGAPTTGLSTSEGSGQPTTSGTTSPPSTTSTTSTTSTPSTTSTGDTAGPSSTSEGALTTEAPASTTDMLESTGTEPGSSSTGAISPEPTALHLAFSPIKQFEFSWSAAAGAEFYQILESSEPGAEYHVFADGIVGESHASIMPLHLRFGASYILRACNLEGCSDSEPVEALEAMAGAIGYLKASNTGAGDFFGYSVALDAGGQTLAVGAPIEASAATGIDGDQNNDTASYAGAVYIFTREGEAWSQQAYIKASNTGAGDRFAWSLALSADGQTLAVGAPFEDSAATGIDGNQGSNAAPQAGAVYVFARDGQTWSQQAYIKASNAGAGDQFGWRVALDGDTLAVSADHEASASTGVNGQQGSNAAPGAGAVYIFEREGLHWSQQAYIKASNAEAEDYFGVDLALAAGGQTLAVGAHFEASAAHGVDGDQTDNSLVQAGAVYVFVRDGQSWSQQAYLKASNPDSDRFGEQIALAGDGLTLAVGASSEDSAAAGIDGEQTDDGLPSGAVYVFVRVADVWSQQAYIKASNPGLGDSFGWGAALSDDGDLLAIGASEESSSATGFGGDQADDAAHEAGAVYVFVRDGQSWSQRAYLKAPNTGPEDHLGYVNSIALTPDGKTLAIGALGEGSMATGIGGPQADDSAPDAGAVYLY